LEGVINQQAMRASTLPECHCFSTKW